MELFIRVLTVFSRVAAATFVGALVIAAFSYKLLLGMLGVTGAWLVGL